MDVDMPPTSVSSEVSTADKPPAPSRNGEGPSTSRRGNKAPPGQPRAPPALVRQHQVPGTSASVPRHVRVGKINYVETDIIGQGGTGNVCRGYVQLTNSCKMDAAVKIMSAEYHKLYENEIKALSQLQYPNIVRYFDTGVQLNARIIAMELADFDMEQYLRRNHSPPLLPELKHYIAQVCEALKCMHGTGEGIIHRDIKPSNILLFNIQNRGLTYIAKLTDFGISKELGLASMNRSTAKGTELYMSPECFRAYSDNHAFESGKASDIYSLGLTIFYILTKGHACGATFIQKMTNLYYGIVHLDGLTEDKWHVPYYHLIEHLLRKNPNERVPIEVVTPFHSFHQVYGHPCFWTPETNIAFVSAASNYLRANKDESLKHEIQVNYGLAEIVNWVSFLDRDIQSLIRRTPKSVKEYDGFHFVKLVKFIRDKDEHFKELPKDVAERIFGRTEASYMNYFLERFPFIIILLFCHLQGVDDRKLNKFYVYKSDSSFELKYRFKNPTWLCPSSN